MEDVLLWISSGHWNLGCVKSMVWRFSSDIPLKNIFWICSCKKKIPQNQTRTENKQNQTKINQHKQEKIQKFLMQVFWRKDWNSGIWIFTGIRNSNFTWKQGSWTILWRHLFLQSHGLDRQAQGWSLEKWDQLELQPPMEQGHPSSWSSPNPSFAS